MSRSMEQISVVGGGLAGSECAFQLAEMGHKVVLFEMRGVKTTPAHKTNRLAELVCSNSFGSTTDYSAPGQLKWEAEQLGSLVLKAAKHAAVPAGMALGVDREVFAQYVTDAIHNHPNIEVRREVVTSLDAIPRPAVIASGPLTDDALAQSLREHFDGEFMYFFDAIAPIIDVDSIDETIAFKADRWGKGNGDYYNCPMNKEQYYALVNEIKNARKIEPKDFEKDTPYFEGCMPVEAIVERGDETLRFGPLSPKGLFDPRFEEARNREIEKNDAASVNAPIATASDSAALSGTEQLKSEPSKHRRPYAVVQLRQDNKQGTAYNMVGFQTKMAYGEQTRVFRMIPGLEKAEFLKLGSIHRNMYIQTPKKLTSVLSSQKDPLLFFAGQITGVEGYFDSTCIGILVAHFLNDRLHDREISMPPRTSAMGSLLNGITEDNDYFQPTNINFGLFPKMEDAPGYRRKEPKDLKRERQLQIAKTSLLEWMRSKGLPTSAEALIEAPPRMPIEAPAKAPPSMPIAMPKAHTAAPPMPQANTAAPAMPSEMPIEIAGEATSLPPAKKVTSSTSQNVHQN